MASLEIAKTAFRKRAPRHSVNLNGWIRQTGLFAVQRCRVIDVSRTGARLEVENNDNIPDNILLVFSRSDLGSPAIVVWRRGTQIGVKFEAGE